MPAALCLLLLIAALAPAPAGALASAPRPAIDRFLIHIGSRLSRPSSGSAVATVANGRLRVFTVHQLITRCSAESGTYNRVGVQGQMVYFAATPAATTVHGALFDQIHVSTSWQYGGGWRRHHGLLLVIPARVYRAVRSLGPDHVPVTWVGRLHCAAPSPWVTVRRIELLAPVAGHELRGASATKVRAYTVHGALSLCHRHPFDRFRATVAGYFRDGPLLNGPQALNGAIFGSNRPPLSAPATSDFITRYQGIAVTVDNLEPLAASPVILQVHVGSLLAVTGTMRCDGDFLQPTAIRIKARQRHTDR